MASFPGGEQQSRGDTDGAAGDELRGAAEFTLFTSPA